MTLAKQKPFWLLSTANLDKFASVKFDPSDPVAVGGAEPQMHSANFALVRLETTN